MKQDTFELFISYSRRDNAPKKPGDAKGWVETLRDEIMARHLAKTTAPLRFFFDRDDIKGMDDWRHRILTGLQQSKILLVCLSPEYFKSDNCLWEWEEFHRHKASRLAGHESVAPVYFVEAPGSDEQATAAFQSFVNRGQYKDGELEKFIPRWREWHAAIRRFNHYDFRPWFDQGSDALAQEAVQARLDELAGNLTDRIARTRRAADAPGNLREFNPHFVGRTRELVKLHETLIRDGAVGVITAVNGLGGQGKTEFAISYAHSHADSYPGGLWVLGAEGRAELLPLFGELAGDARLGIALSAGPEETAAQRGLRVLARMKELALAAHAHDPDGGASCLVILDNVTEPRLLSKPQRSQLPKEDWLRLVATTRLGETDFPIGHGPLAFLEMTSLDEADAVDLIRNHQPPLDADGLRRDFPPATREADEAAARQIARDLGGFTLAIESVAIHLGLHGHIRPAGYLARLRAEGLVSVDALPADADVAAQMEHREKQLALVLEQTLKMLGAAEHGPALTALHYAALLPPDSIAWPWLRALVEQEHPEALATRPGYPDPWATLRRRLEGLRLLTPADHPELARLHRMVAAHLTARLGDERIERLRRLRATVEDFALALQHDIEHDPAVHVWQVLPLQEAVRHWREGEQDTALGHIAGVVGEIERRIGRMDVAQTFLELFHHTAEQYLAANPQSAQAARDVSVSLNKLADFLAKRGQPGDAEAALAHYQRALQISEDLLAANPQSAQAARDVSVSLEKLADFLAARGQPGDAAAALAHYQRALQVREDLLAANPQSAQAARDVSVSLNKLADFLAARGQPGDAEAALAHYQRALQVLEDLLAASPQSAQAARDVSVSLNKLADFLAARGQPGDAEAALAHYQRALQVREDLLAANPQSAQAARDVMVSLERMARMEGSRAGGEANALELQARALGIAIKLREGNPGSLFYGRTVAVSFFLTFQRAQGAGNDKVATQCLTGCFATLDEMIRAGMNLDAPMRQLHAQLQPLFQKPA
ncbi:MAG: toll/interleukin-1 receptor domain-containing protein [Verrucomicrobiaceae bacterium]|nr:toll/interleukin-1 receptor domain-containing protein [Verrucomicrobiaceae bacterium]